MTAVATATLAIRVIPRASKNAISGWRDGRVLVRVTAPPLDGAANDAVVRVVAEALGVPRRAVSIASGETRRDKVVAIAGLDVETLRARLTPSPVDE